MKKSTKKSSSKNKVNFVDDGNKYREKHIREIKNGTFEFFRRSDMKNFVEFPFNEVVNSELPSEINMFNFLKKRTYCNKMDLIIDYNNKIFNAYPYQDELVLSYLSVKWNIDKKSYTDSPAIDDETGNIILDENGEPVIVTAHQEFLEDMYNKIFTPYFVQFIKEYVNDNYVLNIDENNVNKGKFNPVLQFSDEHCKILFAISYGMKISIPLILHFSAMYGADVMNEYLSESFDMLFELFSGNVDIHTKLWESIYSRIIVTKTSDIIYWNYVEIMGGSINQLTSTLYNKLIVDIIPKYEIDQNPVTLNHVFINNNIDFTFRSNIDINFKPLNAAENEDDVSDKELSHLIELIACKFLSIIKYNIW